MGDRVGRGRAERILRSPNQADPRP
jgi:hypothetical protein